MPIVLGVDLGTTKITSLAVDANTGAILAVATAANEANITSETDRGRGRSRLPSDNNRDRRDDSIRSFDLGHRRRPTPPDMRRA